MGSIPVVQCNPDAAPLVERMNADHRTIEPAIAPVEEAARDPRADHPGSGEALGAALSRLSEVLLPHLEREEREMMPLVSTSITDAQWRAWDQEFSIEPKGMQQLGKEGNWLIDGLDDSSRDHVVHLVPPVPRFVLLRILDIRHSTSPRLRGAVEGYGRRTHSVATDSESGLGRQRRSAPPPRPGQPIRGGST